MFDVGLYLSYLQQMRLMRSVYHRCTV